MYILIINHLAHLRNFVTVDSVAILFYLVNSDCSLIEVFCSIMELKFISNVCQVYMALYVSKYKPYKYGLFYYIHFVSFASFLGFLNSFHFVSWQYLQLVETNFSN